MCTIDAPMYICANIRFTNIQYLTNHWATSVLSFFSQHKCEQYWSDNIGEVFETQDKKMTIITTSFMPFADFEIRTFNIKNVCNISYLWHVYLLEGSVC